MTTPQKKKRTYSRLSAAIVGVKKGLLALKRQHDNDPYNENRFCLMAVERGLADHHLIATITESEDLVCYIDRKAEFVASKFTMNISHTNRDFIEVQRSFSTPSSPIALQTLYVMARTSMMLEIFAPHLSPLTAPLVEADSTTPTPTSRSTSR